MKVVFIKEGYRERTGRSQWHGDMEWGHVDDRAEFASSSKM